MKNLKGYWQKFFADDRFFYLLQSFDWIKICKKEKSG